MVPRACADSSGMLSFMPSAGAASTRSKPAETTAASTGRRCTTAAQRSAAGILPERMTPRPSRSRTGWSRRAERRRSAVGSRSRDGLPSRVPVKPSSAGSRVSEPSTVIATVAAAATATPFSSCWRSTSRPSMPIATVVPAVSTERPAVRIAVTAAASGSSPERSASRNLVTMNSA